MATRYKSSIFGFSLVEKNIYHNLSICYKKRYLSRDEIFKKYREKMLAVSLFLFTTSTFLYKRKPEKDYNFHWRNYTQLFSRSNLIDFLDCSLLYLLESNQIKGEDREQIMTHLPAEGVPTFEEYYTLSTSSVIETNEMGHELTIQPISFDKYLDLIALSLRLFEIIQYEIPTNYSKVCDLVELSDIWKEKVSAIFTYRSEYIAFLYFLNLRRLKDDSIKSWKTKLGAFFSLLFYSENE